jgi:thioredoxin-related protein
MLLLISALFATDLEWQKDIDSAFEKAKREHKNVMVMIESEYCRWCKKMKYRTLANESVEKRLASYIVVKVMREDKRAIEGLPPVKVVPTIFFMTPKGEVIESVIGYWGVEDFLSYIEDIDKM